MPAIGNDAATGPRSNSARALGDTSPDNVVLGLLSIGSRMRPGWAQTAPANRNAIHMDE